jgi:uncharacterized cofD-like protein
MGGRKVVAIGGGTGTYTVLSGLKRHDVDLTAIVSMADDGGSSGVLRDEFGHLPPGDVRRCLIALSAEPASGMLRQLFEYRFNRGRGLNGHSFGNLLLTALTEITGAPDLAIQEAARILNVRGRVLPVTLTDVHLCARLEDGTIIRGETNIDLRRTRTHLAISDVYLDPLAHAYPPALEAIAAADIVVIGPGDLYTSVIPNLLVEGIPEAIAATPGKVIYICNLMTKHGETDGFTACDFVREIERYLGTGDNLDAVLVSEGNLPGDLLEKYAEEMSFPVEPVVLACSSMVPQVIVAALAAPGVLWRHDPDVLADAILSLR